MIVLTNREAAPIGWEIISQSDGSVCYRLKAWNRFFDFLDAVIFVPLRPNHRYVWRGQRRSDWSLSSSLDRHFESLELLKGDSQALERQSREHLRSFQLAARGRRGNNPQTISTENDWWALGQHYGLATPLLDWSRSPFAAAYFAFENAADGTEFRIIYALDQAAILQKSAELAEGPSLEEGRPPVIDMFDSMLDENQRVVSQGGLFTRAPIGTPIERWVAQAFEGSSSPVLIRIEIPNLERLTCLRGLDRMNINHLSLFPDLGGSSRFVNLKLELDQ
jgi:FRG domain